MEVNSDRDWYYYSDTSSDSSVEKDSNEWVHKVNSDGSLFFVKNYPRKSDVKEDSRRSESSQNSITCDKSPGILGRFIRRRTNRRSLRRKENRTCKKEINSPMEYKSSRDKGSIEENVEDGPVFVNVNIIENIPAGHISLESLFGLKTIFSDTSILIIGFLPSRTSIYDSKVHLGDKLYSINGNIVFAHNINEVLLGLGNVKEVLLGFKNANNESTETEFSSHLARITSSRFLQDKQQEFFTNNGGVIYAKFEGLTEAGPADQGFIYSYPKKGNILVQLRGAFFTLSHLLSTISSSVPKSTTVRWNNCVLNVLYIHEKSELLLLSLPNSRYYLEEATQVVNSVGRCLEFMFQSLSKCFSNKRNGEFLDSFFQKLLTKNKAEEIRSGTSWEFESLLPVPSSFFLPKDIYMQIDDALNELESNYIPNHGNQRLFTITGSCYFYKGYLVCNHLPNKDLLDVTALMRQNDLLQMCKDGIKDLVYWREIYPLSNQRGTNIQSTAAYSTPAGRWFLLIVGMDHCFLATLLEAGGCTFRILVNSGPEIAYVEETLATLRHIMKIELPNSINEHLNVNSCCTEDLREQTKSASTDSSSSLSSFADLQIQNKQYLSDVHRSSHFLPIKGRQSIENIRFLGNLVDGYDIPEDEVVPVLGRRAERELALETNSQSRISVSDISDDSDLLKDSRSINRNFAFDDCNKNCLPEEYIGSPRFSTEYENLLIHFINFEASEGILISSVAKTDNSNKYNHLLQTFRQQAHKIQKIFLNTILFKKLKTQEMPETFNKSLVAINEYGTLFQYFDETKKGDAESYWVVGRLFFMPHPREVYVCYFDTCPQSMIEIAFQLALSSVR